MKRVSLIIFLCFLCTRAVTQELIGISGKTLPALSYLAGTIPHSGGPSLIYGNQYIIDDFGDLKIFDLTFRLLKKLRLPSPADRRFFSAICVNDQNGDFILIHDEAPSIVIGSDGTLKRELQLAASNSIASDKMVMVLDGKLFFFNDFGQLQYLDYLGQGQAVLAKKEDILGYLDRYPRNMEITQEFKQEVVVFLTKSGILLVDGKLFFFSEEQCLDYIGMLRGHFQPKDKMEAAFMGIRQLLGYDAHGNMYLQVRLGARQYDKLLVVSQHGEYLAFLRFNHAGAIIDGVSAKGDIYFTIDGPIDASQPRQEGLYYYRIRNNWDVISDDEAAAYEKPIRSAVSQVCPASSLMLTALSASSVLSEPDDKNAYHPVKLLDGDPKTMWIENAKGPGIGESVTVGFEAPITVDEIQFMPGAFWKEYWKQNYRVKSLELKLDDKVFTANFKDEMTVQSLKLSAPVTFKTAVFTIKDVYPTTKWEDTAVSEISFNNQGAKVEVDSSKFKEFLKKAP